MYKIHRVVIGVMEPKNFVNCEGSRILKDQGIIVDYLKGMEDDCLFANRHIVQSTNT